MEARLLDGNAQLDLDVTYYVGFNAAKPELYQDIIDRLTWGNEPRLVTHGDCSYTPSFLRKSSLLFYLIENDLPYNEEDFIGVEPIDYSDFRVKEDLKEISTELLKQELANRGYAVETLWSIDDVKRDLSDEEKLAKMNKVLSSEAVTGYIFDILNE